MGRYKDSQLSELPGTPSGNARREMQYRYLGKSGLKVSVLGFGTWVTVGAQIEDEEAERLITSAYDAGVNLFDTAEVYAGGRAEVVLGRTIARNGWPRSSVVVSTKIFWGGRGANERGLSRKHIIEGLDGSLGRLGLDYVDLVFAHRPDPHTPMLEIVRAFTHVIDQGKALYWGTSQWPASALMEAHAIAKEWKLIAPTVEQPEYHMFHRDQVENELAPVMSSTGMGAICWSPLASGVLTGKYIGGIPAGSRASLKGYEWLKAKILGDEGRDRKDKVIELKRLAGNMGCTVAQLAIAWALRSERVSGVLLGAQTPGQLQENLDALRVLDLLTVDVLKEIEAILHNKPVGQRDYRN